MHECHDEAKIQESVNRFIESALSPDHYYRTSIGSTALETLPIVASSPKDVATVLEFLSTVAVDPELEVRCNVLEYIVHIALMLSDPNKSCETLRSFITSHILPIIVTALLDNEKQVVKLADSSLIALLEHCLVPNGYVQERIWPAIVKRMYDQPPIDSILRIITLMSKMVPWVGCDTTETLFVPLFIQLCSHPNMIPRKACASIIGDFCAVVPLYTVEHKLVPSFLALCGDSMWLVRKTCAEVFTSVSSAASTITRRERLAPAFARLLTDPLQYVCLAAFQALGPFITTFAQPSVTNLGFDHQGKLVLRHPDGFEYLFNVNIELDLNERQLLSEISGVNKSAWGYSLIEQAYDNAAERVEFETVASLESEKKTESDSNAWQGAGSDVKENLAWGSQEEIQFSDQAKQVSDEQASVVELNENKQPENISLLTEGGTGDFQTGEALSSDKDTTCDTHQSSSENQSISENQSKWMLVCADSEAFPPLPAINRTNNAREENDNKNTSAKRKASRFKKVAFADDVPDVQIKKEKQKSNHSVNIPEKKEDDMKDEPEKKEDDPKDNRLMDETNALSSESNNSDIALRENTSASEQGEPGSSQIEMPKSNTDSPENTPLQEEKNEVTKSPESSLTEKDFNGFLFWRDPIPNIDIDAELARKKQKETVKIVSVQIITPATSRERKTSLSKCGKPDPEKSIHHAKSQTLFDALMSLSKKRFIDGNGNDCDNGRGSSVVPHELISHFVSMSSPKQDKNNELAHHCAFNLPAVALTLGPSNWALIRQVCNSLAADEQWRVRRTVASSIHELAVIVGSEVATEDLVPVFTGFIKDLDEVRIGALKHLANFLKLLKPAGRNSFLPRLAEFLNTDYEWNWRFRAELGKQLLQILRLFTPAHVASHLAPIAFTLLQDKVAHVRSIAVQLVVEVISIINHEGVLVRSAVAELAEQFAHSSRWCRRQTFAHLCSNLVEEEALPMDIFARDILPHLLDLSWDKVPNVRLSVARTLSHQVMSLDTFSNPSSPHHEIVMIVLKRLQIDKDRDVRFFACLPPFTTSEELSLTPEQLPENSPVDSDKSEELTNQDVLS